MNKPSLPHFVVAPSKGRILGCSINSKFPLKRGWCEAPGAGFQKTLLFIPKTWYNGFVGKSFADGGGETRFIRQFMVNNKKGETL